MALDAMEVEGTVVFADDVLASDRHLAAAVGMAHRWWERGVPLANAGAEPCAALQGATISARRFVPSAFRLELRGMAGRIGGWP